MKSYRQPTPLWPAARATIERYGSSVMDMARVFAPQYQPDFARDPDRCMMDEAVPTIAVAINAYGRGGVVGWVMAQMEDLNRTAGVKDKAESDELRAAAEAVITTYPGLKLTEVMLFFCRFKGGQYGRFYGRADTLVITNALQQFMGERSIAIRRITAAREHVKMLEARLRDFWYAEFDIDELRQSVLWRNLGTVEREIFNKIAMEKDHPGMTWIRYKFHLKVEEYDAPDGHKRLRTVLNPRYHAEDIKVFKEEYKARGMGSTSAKTATEPTKDQNQTANQ